MIAATNGKTNDCVASWGWCRWNDPGEADTRPRGSDPYYDDPYEDFAESVASRVTGNYPNNKFTDSTRWKYVEKQFGNYRERSQRAD